jgi:hypothetical protein
MKNQVNKFWKKLKKEAVAMPKKLPFVLLIAKMIAVFVLVVKKYFVI